MRLILASVWLVLVATATAHGQNYPCSGGKGGVSHCQGQTFVCNDGSVSRSKRNCSADHPTSRMLGVMGAGNRQMVPVQGQTACACRSGTYCTGPKGGRFCLTDNGRKSYLP